MMPHPGFQLEEVAKRICEEESLRLIGAVGVGAFKETYQVQATDGSNLALKVHRPGSLTERAGREIDAMLRFCHPNIGRLNAVNIHSEADTQYLYSLEEFLSGGTLAQLLGTRGTLPRDEVLALGGALISAIAAVARERLVHRDIKPENVMLRPDRSTPVLVDFGLVRNLEESSLTHTWAVRGPATPLYAPAEQLLNDKAGIDWRADQFALAVLLSFAAFGFHPYSETEGNNAATIQRVAARSPQSTRFLVAAGHCRLPELIRMSAPWPVHRHRTPQLLEAAWAAQGRAG